MLSHAELDVSVVADLHVGAAYDWSCLMPLVPT